jgi:hypothetical protein
MNKKNLKIKGFWATCAVMLIIASYVAYNYVYYEKGYKLNELYFISTGVGIAILSGILMTFFKNKFVRTSLLFCSVFYTFLEVAYVWSWITLNHAYAYIKLSLFVGLLIGLIYVVYDYIRRFTAKPDDPI